MLTAGVLAALRSVFDGVISLRSWIAPMAVAGLTLCAGPALAQRHWEPNQIPYCLEQLAETCGAQEMAGLLGKLELPTAEAWAAEGYKGVRILRYDAFGTIWPAVSFMSRPLNEYRREGFAEARTLHADGHVAILTRPVWEIGWNEVDRIIEAVRDRQEPEPEPDMKTMIAQGRIPLALRCLDPPRVIVELVDSGEVKRWNRPSCGGDPATERVHDVAILVAAAFPTCGHFAIERYGHGTGRLRACLMAGGAQPIAAAEVLEALQVGIGGDARRAYAAEMQAPDVTLLAIDGRRFEGRAGIEAAWKEKALGDRWLRVLRAEGDADGVTVAGQLLLTRSSGARDPLAATLRFRKQADGEWQIVSWKTEQRPDPVP